MMKLVVFDVSNAACSLAVCPKGYSLMVDCGSHTEKGCPIDQVIDLKDVLGMIKYNNYDLTLLHITHPDDDHVRNAKKLKEKMPPYLLHRRKTENFPNHIEIPSEYESNLCKKYRGEPIDFNLWGWNETRVFSIPMDKVTSDEELSKSIKNNSSILRYIEYTGIKILFGGDMEKAGWEWLLKNDKDFLATIIKGIDIFIAPHHGHKSGYPGFLFEKAGNVMVSILSKGSESEKEETDVSSQYSQNSNGVKYKALSDKQLYFANTITTRSNGNVYIFINNDGTFTITTEKASSNHQMMRI